MLLLLITSGCYAVCTIADKIAVDKHKVDRNSFTFLMGLSSCFFMFPLIAFTDTYIKSGYESIAYILIVVIIKMLEFYTSAIIFTKLTGFEVKAWLGVSIILSYFTNVIIKAQPFSTPKIISVFIICVGLYFIAGDKTSKTSNKYKGIFIPLALYIVSKYAYGLIIKKGSEFISPNLCVFISLLILTIIFAIKVSPRVLFIEKRKGSLLVFLARIPNTIGLFAENILITVSLTLYSLEQPLILAILFTTSLLRKEKLSKRKIFGNVVCVLGVFVFYLV